MTSEYECESGPTFTSRPGGASTAAGLPLHMRSFKLRFAPQRELGRSNVSLIKPLSLPSTVTGKFHWHEEPVDEELLHQSQQRVEQLYANGPREKYDKPITSAHEYGWWWFEVKRFAGAPRNDRRVHHHIRDSAWLKERLRILAADNKLKQK